MRVVLNLTVVALLLSACGQSATQPQASPTREKFGTATLTDTGCDFAMPDRLDVGVVSVALVNHAGFTGRFMLVYIHDGHTYKDLIDNSVNKKPSWVTDIALVDVGKGGSSEMLTTVVDKGIYAFHCGYVDESGKFMFFWHELKAA